MENELVVLDFDGVICDSVDECFVSSWLAYDLHTGVERTSCTTEYRALFAQYRPFIRRGADYVLLQQCIENAIVLSEQHDYDEQERLCGVEIMERFHELFYQARSTLLEHERLYWISLNRLYPGMATALTSPEPTWHILSTKKSSFILEILDNYGIEWEPSRVHYSGQEKKVPYILGIMDSLNMSSAVFIDDQIDHFTGFEDSAVRCRLADWGYVKPEWVAQNRFRSVSLDELSTALLQRTRLP